jgi:hypothetical protein
MADAMQSDNSTKMKQSIPDRRSWLRYGTPPGDFSTAPRCGAHTKVGDLLPGAGDGERAMPDARREECRPAHRGPPALRRCQRAGHGWRDGVARWPRCRTVGVGGKVAAGRLGWGHVPDFSTGPDRVSQINGLARAGRRHRQRPHVSDGSNVSLAHTDRARATRSG